MLTLFAVILCTAGEWFFLDLVFCDCICFFVSVVFGFVISCCPCFPPFLGCVVMSCPFLPPFSGCAFSVCVCVRVAQALLLPQRHGLRGALPVPVPAAELLPPPGRWPCAGQDFALRGARSFLGGRQGSQMEMGKNEKRANEPQSKPG